MQQECAAEAGNHLSEYGSLAAGFNSQSYTQAFIKVIEK